MKAIEQRLPQDLNKSFIVFKEKGKFFHFPWHYHPEYELVLVTKSTGHRIVGDHIDYFEEGDLVFVGDMVPHVWINDSKYFTGQADSPAEAIVIHFVRDFLGEEFFNIPEMEFFNKILKLSKRGMVIKGKTKERITALMNKMLFMNGIERLSSLFTIFNILCSSYEYEILISPGYKHKQLNSSDRFSKVMEYILRNFDRAITLPEIASIANMGTTSFSIFFKKNYRITFVEFLNTVRVGHACKLLGEKDHNVIEIAYECGFNNLSNFNRQFKKIKKMTPSKFRKTLQLEKAISEKKGSHK